MVPTPGLATAQQFVEEGAYVFIAGRRQNELDKAVKQIGKNVTDVQGDISNLADLDRLYDTVKQQKGRIDVLFANAGIAEFAPLGSITESLFDKIFNIHVRGQVGYSMIKKNTDGSVDIHVQHQSPGKGNESNWLRSPEGSFYIRVYYPLWEYTVQRAGH